LDHSCNLISGFRKLENRKPCNKIREIAKCKVPKGKKDLKIMDSGEWTSGILFDTEVKPLLTISGFRGLKNQKFSIGTRKVAKSEILKRREVSLWASTGKCVRIWHFSISEDKKSRILSRKF
jgi:hypothetical protein